MLRLLETYRSTVKVSAEDQLNVENVLTIFAAVAKLAETDLFSDMDLQTDEDEHSIEMHLPYIRKVFEG